MCILHISMMSRSGELDFAKGVVEPYFQSTVSDLCEWGPRMEKKFVNEEEIHCSPSTSIITNCPVISPLS